MTNSTPADREPTAGSPGRAYPVIGELRPWIGAIVDPSMANGFDEYLTRHVRGLAQVRGDHIDILAVAADPEGSGHGGRFIDALKHSYKRVRILHIDNPLLAGMLLRRGFKVFAGWEAGQAIDGMQWSSGDSPPEDHR